MDLRIRKNKHSYTMSDIYRAYNNLATLDKSNSYYHYGQNILGFVPTSFDK